MLVKARNLSRESKAPALDRHIRDPLRRQRGWHYGLVVAVAQVARELATFAGVALVAGGLPLGWAVLLMCLPPAALVADHHWSRTS